MPLPPCVILFLPKPEPGDPFLSLPWNDLWTDIRHTEDEFSLDLGSGPYVRALPGAALPDVVGTDCALYISELDQLEIAVRNQNVWRNILFAPSHTAKMECLRRTRKTLAAKHTLSAGRTLSATDIIEIHGGGGLAANLKSQIVGGTLCYDVARGEDITFGTAIAPNIDK